MRLFGCVWTSHVHINCVTKSFTLIWLFYSLSNCCPENLELQKCLSAQSVCVVTVASTVRPHGGTGMGDSCASTNKHKTFRPLYITLKFLYPKSRKTNPAIQPNSIQRVSRNALLWNSHPCAVTESLTWYITFLVSQDLPRRFLNFKNWEARWRLLRIIW